MSEEIKSTDEEMSKIRNFQKEYSDLQIEFGQIKLSRLGLEDKLNELVKKEDESHKKFFDLQEKEKSFLDETTKKYGEGNLNPQTGVFTPNKSS